MSRVWECCACGTVAKSDPPERPCTGCGGEYRAYVSPPRKFHTAAFIGPPRIIVAEARK